MNIVYHHRTQAKGAEGVHIREIVKALKGLNNRVYIASPPGVDISEENLSDTGVKRKLRIATLWKFLARHLPQFLFELLEIVYNFSAMSMLDNFIKTKDIDFVYERNAFFCWAGVAIARKHKIPIILEVNEISGIKRVRGLLLGFIAHRIERRNFIDASAIVVVSPFLKRQIAARGINEDKIYVVPNGVNLVDFTIHEDKNQVIIKEFDLENKIVLGFVGSFVPWHNFDFLIKSFKQILDLSPKKDIVLMLVGDGAQRKYIQKLSRDLGIEKRVIFTGLIKHQDISKYINLMDICIIPHSNEYRSPIKLFEYMAMAKPVIAPDLEPIRAVIADGENGLLFQQGDVADFSSAVISIVSDKEKIKSIGNNARQTIVDNYTWEKNARLVIEIYKKMVNCQ